MFPSRTKATWPLPGHVTVHGSATASALRIVVVLPARALTCCIPGVMPRVHAPEVAMPNELVSAVSPAMLPPPESTVNVTATSGMGLEYASATRTHNGDGRTAPTGPHRTASPLVICATGPAAATALNVTLGTSADRAITL